MFPSILGNVVYTKLYHNNSGMRPTEEKLVMSSLLKKTVCILLTLTYSDHT